MTGGWGMIRTRIQRMIGEAEVKEIGKLIVTTVGLRVILIVASSAAGSRSRSRPARRHARPAGAPALLDDEIPEHPDVAQPRRGAARGERQGASGGGGSKRTRDQVRAFQDARLQGDLRQQGY